MIPHYFPRRLICKSETGNLDWFVRRLRNGCFGFVFEFPELVFDFAARFFAHAIDEEDSVQVIDFVLDAASKNAVAFENVRISVDVLVFQANPIGAFDIPPNSGERKTAFFVGGFGTFEKFELRIDDRHRHDEVDRRFPAVEGIVEIPFALGHVDDAELKILSDLLRRYTDAVRFTHGDDHFLNQIAERWVEAADLLAFRAENWFFV